MAQSSALCVLVVVINIASRKLFKACKFEGCYGSGNSKVRVLEEQLHRIPFLGLI